MIRASPLHLPHQITSAPAPSTQQHPAGAGLGWWVASTATLIQCNELVRAQVARKQGIQLLKLHAATFMLALVGGAPPLHALAHSPCLALSLLSSHEDELAGCD